MSDVQTQLRLALGGEYRLPGKRVFWMDHLAVDEILRRLEAFDIRARPRLKCRNDPDRVCPGDSRCAGVDCWLEDHFP